MSLAIRAIVVSSTIASATALAQANAQVATRPVVTSTRSMSASAALDSGVVLYEEVAYELSARLLRYALGGTSPDSLSARQRSAALTYLGASEWYLHHRDSANAAFRSLLAHAPFQRLDSLIFPKSVTDFFDGIRRSLHGVARVREVDRAIRVTVLAINPHRVTVEVFAEGGPRVRSLYEAPITDSVHVDWDERDADGRAVTAGRYTVVVTARANDGQLLSVARFPVDIGRTPAMSDSGR
ncbi:MAG TPA: FlgD immunoglobulin-like domain containing protein [Gemmatimonadaceae bacterium]|nr:FlgD immunoglobulin-like domain containing protein [Gemmatimonadaceae bacterium]